MSKEKAVSLVSGQQTEIVVSSAMSGEIRCLSGQARIMNQRLGIGWWMREGDGCVLRSDTRYRVIAKTAVRISIHPKRVETENHTLKRGRE